MRPTGRIVTFIGVALIAAAIVGGALGWTQFGPVPGIVLLFLGRIMSKQAGRPEPAGERSSSQDSRPAPMPPVMPPRSAPATPRSAKAQTAPSRERPSPPLEPISERTDVMEAVHDAPSGVTDDFEASPSTAASSIDPDAPVPQPMSSAEMIARAHERWGRRP